MVTKEALEEQFQSLGINVENDVVLGKCIDLCVSYNIDEETFVERWIAFSVPRAKLHEGDKGLEPTIEALGQMERIDLKKDKKLNAEMLIQKDLSKRAVYNLHSSKQYDEPKDIFEMYGSKEPTTQNAKRSRSPESETLSVNETKVRAVECPFSPSSFSPKPKCTQVVLVPSSRDAHHDPVYPTPEYFVTKKLKCENLHLMPDPCTMDIEGLIVGVTSIDTLMHLGREEISSNAMGMDRLSRLANHLLSQSCFYPLCPSAEEVNIDMELWKKYAFMNQQPHLLFLPSDMRHFCKPVNGCIVLNPERLNKYSFARLIVKPVLRGETLSEKNVSCEILKI